MNKTLVTVCARGGSKGIPGKNIKPIGSLPLIAYTIKDALEYAATHAADVALSTDSEAIKEVAAQYGLSYDYVRPAYLADDVCGKPDAIKDVMLYAESQRQGAQYDMVIDLDVTSPMRTMQDIERMHQMLAENPEALTIFSVSPCGRNPYFNQVEQKANGYYAEVKDKTTYTSRQTSPKVYDINGSIYVYRREALLPQHPKAVTQRSLVYVMDHLCFDLDEPADYDYLSYLVDTGRIVL